MRNRIVLLWLLGFAILVSCGNQTEQKRSQAVKRETVNLIRFTEPSHGKLFQLGDEICIKLKLIDENVQPDSIILYVDNHRQGKVEGTTYCFETHQLSLGTKQLRATAWLNGTRQTASVGIKLKSDTPPKSLRYRVVNVFPHDAEAYTQGLFFYEGNLIESTGQRGMSSLRRVELSTGKVLQSVNLDRSYFGEGTTLYNDEIYQITWTSRKGFVYDAQTFNLKRTFNYPTQGWGLTTAHEQLVMSDGSNVLYFLEPQSFTEQSRIEVYDNNGPVNQLNELEWIDGKIYANIYLSERMVIIDPTTGRVEAEVDFSNLLDNKDKHANIDVFNGIAWDGAKRRLFVTGKNWPKLFEVKLLFE